MYDSCCIFLIDHPYSNILFVEKLLCGPCCFFHPHLSHSCLLSYVPGSQLLQGVLHPQQLTLIFLTSNISTFISVAFAPAILLILHTHTLKKPGQLPHTCIIETPLKYNIFLEIFLDSPYPTSTRYTNPCTLPAELDDFPPGS